MRLTVLLFICGLLGTFMGCVPSSGGGGGGGSSCEEGETRDCTCPDGSDSVRVCEDERLTAFASAGREGNGSLRGALPPNPGLGGASREGDLGFQD